MSFLRRLDWTLGKTTSTWLRQDQTLIPHQRRSRSSVRRRERPPFQLRAVTNEDKPRFPWTASRAAKTLARISLRRFVRRDPPSCIAGLRMTGSRFLCHVMDHRPEFAATRERTGDLPRASTQNFPSAGQPCWEASGVLILGQALPAVILQGAGGVSRDTTGSRAISSRGAAVPFHEHQRGRAGAVEERDVLLAEIRALGQRPHRIEQDIAHRKP